MLGSFIYTTPVLGFLQVRHCHIPSPSPTAQTPPPQVNILHHMRLNKSLLILSRMADEYAFYTLIL
jgi:hypothetical protein